MCLCIYCILTWSPPVLHFHMLQNKLNTICRNSDDLHQKTLRKRNTMTRICIIALKTFTKPVQAQDSQGYKTCTGPIFSRIQAYLIVPKQTWDSWESWARAGFVYFIQRDSWACAWIVPFVLFKPLDIFVLFKFCSIQTILKAETCNANSLRTKALTSLKRSLDCSGLNSKFEMPNSTNRKHDASKIQFASSIDKMAVQSCCSRKIDTSEEWSWIE